MVKESFGGSARVRVRARRAWLKEKYLRRFCLMAIWFAGSLDFSILVETDFHWTHKKVS